MYSEKRAGLHGWLGVVGVVGVLALTLACAGEDMDMAGFDDDVGAAVVRDPLQPVNRGFYHVNDRLYFWVLKPLATGYSKVVPVGVREGVRNVFTNIGMPKRLVNCLLQAKFRGAGDEVVRFCLNSTVGFLGYRDFAEAHCGIAAANEDFGQTLGTYGVGYGIYLTLPIFGPSNPRDAVGLVADSFLDPLTYVFSDLPARLAVRAGDRVNDTSLRLGDYEKSKETALDHYISLRESYTQYRDGLIGR